MITYLLPSVLRYCLNMSLQASFKNSLLLYFKNLDAFTKKKIISMHKKGSLEMGLVANLFGQENFALMSLSHCHEFDSLRKSN